MSASSNSFGLTDWHVKRQLLIKTWCHFTLYIAKTSGQNIQIRLRVRPSPSRSNRTSLTFPPSKASICRQEVGSKSFRPKKGMLSPSSKPANYLNIFIITLCICYNGRHLEKQACSSIITVIYIRFSIFLVKYNSVVDSTAVGHNHCETLSHLSSL